MEFPPLTTQYEEMLASFRKREKFSESQLRCVVSPYRICPLGAHVDHQGGNVLGRTVNAYTLLAFVPLAEPVVRIYSLNFPGVTAFRFDEIGPPSFAEWGRYVRGAAEVLSRKRPLRFGMVGVVKGTLPGSGLSSSTSVGLAYLRALAACNELELSPVDFIELDRELENDYLGLENGILDQSTIVYGLRGSLVHIDTREGSIEYVEDPKLRDSYRTLIAYSGYSRELTATKFNIRVQECRQAAKLLGKRAGLKEFNALSDIPEDVYYTHRNSFPPNLMRRAEHYYSEVKRVENGRVAWAGGDLVRFGALMNESCQSSIHNYECGSEPIKVLQEIVSTTDGIYGSRFSGGGYGGCVVGLASAASAQDAARSIEGEYLRAHPAAKGRATIYLAQSESGLRLL